MDKIAEQLTRETKTMKLHAPFKISPSLLPALQIGKGWLEANSIEDFQIILPNGETYQVEDFRPGACCNLQDAFAAILGFLSAWHESIYPEPTEENAGLFDANNQELVGWVIENSDEITILEMEIEESEKQLIEI